jgi:hypothetical protein
MFPCGYKNNGIDALKMSMAIGGTQQGVDQVNTMEIDDSGPAIRLSPKKIPRPRIVYFLH